MKKARGDKVDNRRGSKIARGDVERGKKSPGANRVPSLRQKEAIKEKKRPVEKKSISSKPQYYQKENTIEAKDS